VCRGPPNHWANDFIPFVDDLNLTAIRCIMEDLISNPTTPRIPFQFLILINKTILWKFKISRSLLSYEKEKWYNAIKRPHFYHQSLCGNNIKMKTIYFSLLCRFPMRRNPGWLTQPRLISLFIKKINVVF
jgi:hypothetical protein